jgi:hypothetical protein
LSGEIGVTEWSRLEESASIATSSIIVICLVQSGIRDPRGILRSRRRSAPVARPFDRSLPAIPEHRRLAELRHASSRRPSCCNARPSNGRAVRRLAFHGFSERVLASAIFRAPPSTVPSEFQLEPTGSIASARWIVRVRVPSSGSRYASPSHQGHWILRRD